MFTHPVSRLRALVRRPATYLVLTAAAAVLAVVLALFEPWKLWVDRTVHEPPPAAGRPSGPTGVASSTAPANPVVLASGTFVSHEHTTTGTARVLRTPDGARYLRLDDLDTSNGPLLKVWLSDAPVVAGTTGWRLFDRGRHADLGPLKGNKGSQNYPLPADLDLTGYRSVTIWCARFHVSFGAATLTTEPAGTP
jgi:Electron transfer DM13